MNLFHPQGGDEALRIALLQRIADRLAYARACEQDQIEWNLPNCCWIHYEWPTPAHYGYREYRFVHQLCAGGCPHWHHWTEVWMA
jgi:hypothetical protein